MRKFLLAGAVALAALTATPAVAQTNAGFTGPRAELQLGASDSNVSDTDITYGVALGADTAVTDRVTLGADVNATNVFDRRGRVLGAGVRVGYAINPTTLAYVRGGYANLDLGHDHVGGYTAGGGLELKFNRNYYINTEYRYSNYQRGVDSHAGLLGLGIRFK